MPPQARPPKPQHALHFLTGKSSNIFHDRVPEGVTGSEVSSITSTIIPSTIFFFLFSPPLLSVVLSFLFLSPFFNFKLPLSSSSHSSKQSLCAIAPPPTQLHAFTIDSISSVCSHPHTQHTHRLLALTKLLLCEFGGSTNSLLESIPSDFATNDCNPQSSSSMISPFLIISCTSASFSSTFSAELSLNASFLFLFFFTSASSS
mmetsp:Transcript_2233/g.7030  ORF Transcript_2233/g.7030 Transcript_2233/m.7030 type:complete len:203 (+) Transcript_2233:2746-3354(+)